MGFDAAAGDRRKDRAATYPERPIYVKLVAESTGRLLGGQVAGTIPLPYPGESTSWRLPSHGVWTSSLSYLDLSYAPPFAPVWDPLLVAANVLQRDL